MEATAFFFIHVHRLPLPGPLALLLAGMLEHAGMFGNDDLKPVLGDDLLDHGGQLFLAVGVDLADGGDAQALEHAAQGNGRGRAVEVLAGGRMLLVPGHGRGAVFHDDQGQVVLIENGIDDARDAGMEKGRIAEKGHDLAVAVE